MYSPFLRTVAFWGTFYGSYHYARRDPQTKQHVYPSYLILKQKLIKDTWNQGFDSAKFSESFALYRQEFWLELKSIWK